MKVTSKTLLRAVGIGAAALFLTTATAGNADAWWGHRRPVHKWFKKHHDRKHGQVPEIDPGTAGTAITLLAGGLAVLRDRRRKR